MIESAVVVGGGISGLVAARRLALAGKKVTLLESSDRLGGLIRGVSLAGQTVDVGAEAFAVSRPDTLQLITELGLEYQLVSPQNSEARILSDGRFFKIPHGVLGIPSDLDDPALAEAIGADAVAEAKRLDAKPWNLTEAGTVAELVITRLGQAVLDTLVTPVIAGVHSSDPSLLEINAVAPGLFALAAKLGSLTAAAAQLRASAARPGAAVASLRGGMHTLVEKLVSAIGDLGVEVRLNTPAAGTFKTPDGYQVLLQDGTRLSANYLVLATPPRITAQILGSFPTLATPLALMRAVDVTVVALVVTDHELDSAPVGSGVLVAPSVHNIDAKATTHATGKWEWLANEFGKGKHLVRLSYGRDGIVPAADDTLLATARADAQALYGISADQIGEIVVQEWPGAMIQSRSGHLSLVNQILDAQKDFPNLALVGAGLGGNGITGILAKSAAQYEQIGL